MSRPLARKLDPGPLPPNIVEMTAILGFVLEQRFTTPFFWISR